MNVRTASARRLQLGAVALAALGFVAAGCTANAEDRPQADTMPSGAASASPSPTPQPQAEIAANVSRHGVPIDKQLQLSVAKGTFRHVVVRAKKGEKLAGDLSQDKTSWSSSGRLEPGTKYVVRSAAVDDQGLTTRRRSHFRTEALTLDEQTYPSFAPLAGSTVGVGMPVIVKFDVPVADHATIQRHLHVSNTAHQKGGWHWINDNEVHWRPVHYWKPGTDVTVTADINSVPAGEGIYGQLDRTETFHIGRSMVSKVNIDTHELRVFRNGQPIRTIPVTTGKPGFNTRSGTKVIVQKYRHKRMNSETIGINPHSANGYDLDDVEYAMRLTYSGEFLHAAPWSVSSQGNANVSHGCTGMSTANAGWLYRHSLVGDPVQFTGGDGDAMSLTNGFGDWNLPFPQYRERVAQS